MDNLIMTDNRSLSRRKFLALTTAATSAIGVAPTLLAQQPASPPSHVQLHGHLRTKGNKITGKSGDPAVLRGMSLFWSQWMGQFYNADTIRWLRDDWHCSVVRAAMGIETAGYIGAPLLQKGRICKVVEAAIDLGMYVIIDWHDHDANQRTLESQEFFAEMAKSYGQSPNVIFEIWSAPHKTHDWAQVIKPYHEAVIPKIREHSSNLIVCGTPRWSQEADKAADDPLKFDNVAYALNFNAGAHQFVRAKAKAALDKGIALMVTQWLACDSSNGTLAIDDARVWIEFMKEHNLSWCNWSVGNKEETASALLPDASGKGGWTEAELTDSGKFVRELLRSSS